MRVVVLLQLGPVAAPKQYAACIEYAIQCGYEIAALIGINGDSRDAVKMIRRGRAQVVVVAYGGRQLAGDVIAAGGRVEAVHPRPHVVEPLASSVVEIPRSSGGLLARLRARGKTVEQIAAFLDSTTDEVRRLLRRGE